MIEFGFEFNIAERWPNSETEFGYLAKQDRK